MTDKTKNLLVIMARAPIAGKVKTRLIPAMGKKRATLIYQILLDTITRELSPSDHYRLILSCTPETTHPKFTSYRLNRRIGIHKQPTGCLGRRMYRIIAAGLRKYQNVIIIGSDLTNLTRQQVENAFQTLHNNDLVLGLAQDGGYGLIGMKKNHPHIFRSMPWSSARVARLTLERIQRANLKLVTFTGLLDIDTPQDYRTWIRTSAQTTQSPRKAIADEAEQGIKSKVHKRTSRLAIQNHLRYPCV